MAAFLPKLLPIFAFSLIIHCFCPPICLAVLVCIDYKIVRNCNSKQSRRPRRLPIFGNFEQNGYTLASLRRVVGLPVSYGTAETEKASNGRVPVKPPFIIYRKPFRQFRSMVSFRKKCTERDIPRIRRYSNSQESCGGDREEL